MEVVSWRELYRAAMLELDLSTMQSRIEAAVEGIHLRMEEVARTDGGSRREVQEMSDALRSLRTLRNMGSGIPAAPDAPRRQEGAV